MDTKDLTELAEIAMHERGFWTTFSNEAAEAAEKQPSSFTMPPFAKDLTKYLWCSIDNDDSKDLDQLTYAERVNGHYKIYIAIAEVDHLVPINESIDLHARHNTTSVYTPTKVFPMLPLRYSTDLSSLNPHQNRLAIVVEVEINSDGSLGSYQIYYALVHSHAKLAYNSISPWLEQKSRLPQALEKNPELAENLLLQDQIAQLLKAERYKNGALDLETIESKPVFKEGKIVALQPSIKNRARYLIEEFMIAANTATALFLKKEGRPSLRRVVRTPKNWERIIQLAKEKGATLPQIPDSKALNAFLQEQKKINPHTFDDLSLAIIKLLGAGEYVVEKGAVNATGHFGLSIQNYTHATAPNRRFSDLITQRLTRSILLQSPSPYTIEQLEDLASHCTKKENDAEKVERRIRKSAAILVLSNQIGETFNAIVTGASSKGTWVKIFNPPIEGKLIKGFKNLEVGDSIKVQLIGLSIEKGFIDFTID
jgi:exoribonuclease-2